MCKVKVTVLLPNQDNEGYPLAYERESILDESYAVFGGYTIGETVTGTYRMEDGTKATDRCTTLFVIIDKLRVPELRAMVARWGKMLRQETMFLDVEPSNVEFIRSEA